VEQPIAVDERKIAHEDGDALAVTAGLTAASGCAMFVGEHDMRDRLATTTRGSIHHVVVEQGERVEKLESGPGVDGSSFVGSAGSLMTPEAERRTQPLASRGDQTANLGDRRSQVGIER
ncbi:MAG: hypothetical protein RL413_1722, partial [Actinomycetota bacterium]